MGFPCDTANTVNNDSDIMMMMIDIMMMMMMMVLLPVMFASTVDAADCGNEHDDKVKTFSLSMHGSW